MSQPPDSQKPGSPTPPKNVVNDIAKRGNVKAGGGSDTPKPSNKKRNRRRSNKPNHQASQQGQKPQPNKKPSETVVSKEAQEAKQVYPEMPAMVADVQATLDKIKAAKSKAKTSDATPEKPQEALSANTPKAKSQEKQQKPVKKATQTAVPAPPHPSKPSAPKPLPGPNVKDAPANAEVDRIKALMAAQKNKKPATPKPKVQENTDPTARLKELFEQKKREKQEASASGEPKPSSSTKQQGSKPAHKPDRPAPPKPQAGSQHKPSPKPQPADTPGEKKDDKKSNAPDDESPADRLRRLLEERKKEREQEREKEQQEEEAKQSEEEQRATREAEARARAEEEIREKYRAQREAREKRRKQSQAVTKSRAAPPAGPTPKTQEDDERNVSEALLALEKWWNVLSKTTAGRVIKRIVEFYQKVGAVAVWTLVLFVVSRYVVKFITGWLNNSAGFDMFSLKQWWALGQLYFKYKVPDDIVLTMMVVSLIWISGGLVFWGRGWPWVRPIYLFFLQLMFLPVGLTLFTGFVFLVITRHVWRKLRKA